MATTWKINRPLMRHPSRLRARPAALPSARALREGRLTVHYGVRRKAHRTVQVIGPDRDTDDDHDADGKDRVLGRRHARSITPDFRKQRPQSPETRLQIHGTRPLP